MDSQVTLVDPASATSDRATLLHFDQDDMSNTIIRTDNNQFRYVVLTSGKTTTISRCSGVIASMEILATVKQRHLKPDLITFSDVRAAHLNAWLKSPLFSVFPISFQDSGKKFEWTESFAGQLFLREVTSQGAVTAGWFARASKRIENGRQVICKPYLALKPRVLNMMDTILVACVLTEQRLRMTAGKNMGMAGAKAAGGQIALLGVGR